MSLHEMLAGGGGLTLALLVLVEISPLKINPWSFIARTIGHALNGEVIEKVSKLEDDIRQIQHEAAKNEAVSCRTRILRFGDEILHGVHHTKEHFDQILRDITSYERYCAEHPEFENNMAVLTIERIKSCYLDRLHINDFL